jgi:small multidrug resistance pump
LPIANFENYPNRAFTLVWSGCGIVLIAAVAWIIQGQKFDVPAMAGMGLIVAGVIVMNAFSKTAAH